MWHRSDVIVTNALFCVAIAVIAYLGWDDSVRLHHRLDRESALLDDIHTTGKANQEIVTRNQQLILENQQVIMQGVKDHMDHGK